MSTKEKLTTPNFCIKCKYVSPLISTTCINCEEIIEEKLGNCVLCVFQSHKEKEHGSVNFV